VKVNPFLIGGIAILGYFAWKKYNLVTHASVQFADLQVTSWSPLAIVAVFAIRNPTSGSAELQSINGFINVNGQRVASIDSTSAMTVAPNSTSNVSLKIVPLVVGFATAAAQWLANKQSVNISFSGTIQVDGITIPLTQSLYSA
jgi:LEA14-like dessication related protein